MPLILDARGNPIRQRPDSSVRARYDAAQRSEETSRHWAEADCYSARAANSLEVRRILRDRCRYEVENNSWAGGIADAMADFMVGDGPTLKVDTTNKKFNKLVEAEWEAWAEQVCLDDKLWRLRRIRAVDGEAFLFMSDDPDYEPISLDMVEYEADQVSTPFLYPLDEYQVDGIELNRFLKPAYYHLLYEHPGDMFTYLNVFKYRRVPAKQVIHWFKPTRPGQYRGIPEFTKSLPLFANLRRYRDATIAAAETAASFAAMLYTENPPDSTEDGPENWEKIPIDRRMLTTVPAGWKMAQLKAEQPTTGHPDFVRVCLTELSAGHSTTYEIASGDYSNVNYSSGRLGHQRFQRAITTDRWRMERNCLNVILREWLREAVMIGLIPDLTSRADGWIHRWLWPGIESIDPLQEAKAQQIRLEIGTTTLAEECAKEGADYEARRAQLATEKDDFDKMGMPPPYGKTQPVPQDQESQDQQNQQDQQSRNGGGNAPPAPDQGSGKNGRARARAVSGNGQY